jgi:tetratricopeptide (TPR) repeat protein
VSVEAAALAERLDDGLYVGRAAAYLCSALVMSGEPRAAVEQGGRALALGAALGDPTAQVVAHFYLGRMYRFRQQAGEAVRHLQACLRLLRDRSPGERFGMGSYVAVTAREELSYALGQTGEFDAALGHANDALRIADELGQASSRAIALLAVASAYLLRGEWSKAAPVLAHGWAVVPTGQVFRLSMASKRALVLAWSGRREEALEGLAAAWVELSKAGIAPYGEAAAQLDCAEAYLLVGRVEDATRYAERALMVAQDDRLRGHAAWAHRLLGEIALRSDSSDGTQAEAHFCEGFAVAQELGMRPLLAHCHLGLGKLYRRVGQLEEARAELSTAIGMLGEMGMTLWLPEAEAELAKVDDSEPADR